MSPLDQVIAELELERQHIELTLAFLRGRRSLAAVTAPPPPRLVPPAVSATADAAVGEAFTAAQKALAPTAEPVPVPAGHKKAPAAAPAPRQGAARRTAATPAPAVPAKPVKAPKVRALAPLSPLAQRVLDRLDGNGVKAMSLAVEFHLKAPRVRVALQQLRRRGLARTIGSTTKAVWVAARATKPASTPAPAAKPAAAPNPKAPAPAKPTVRVDGQDFEVVTSAAVERAGGTKLSEVRA